jgi:hypothetical protein
VNDIYDLDLTRFPYKFFLDFNFKIFLIHNFKIFLIDFKLNRSSTCTCDILLIDNFWYLVTFSFLNS